MYKKICNQEAQPPGMKLKHTLFTPSVCSKTVFTLFVSIWNIQAFWWNVTFSPVTYKDWMETGKLVHQRLKMRWWNWKHHDEKGNPASKEDKNLTQQNFFMWFNLNLVSKAHTRTENQIFWDAVANKISYIYTLDHLQRGWTRDSRFFSVTVIKPERGCNYLT